MPDIGTFEMIPAPEAKIIPFVSEETKQEIIKNSLIYGEVIHELLS